MLPPTTILISILLLIAGLYDWKYRRLPGPGGFTIPLLILAVGIYSLLMEPQSINGIILLVNLLLGLAAITFYVCRIMAAGDTKILLALCLTSPFTLNAFFAFLFGLLPGGWMIISKVRPIPLITCMAIGYLATIILLVLL